jgi:hypothetical protein
MNRVWQRISAEPAVATGAVVAFLNAVAAFRVWTPAPEQLAAVNSMLVAFFALVVRATVDHRHGTPVRLSRPRPRRGHEPPPRPREPIGEPVAAVTKPFPTGPPWD